MIEKNIDLSGIYKKSERNLPWYMIGYTLLGIGIGLVISFIIAFTISQKQYIGEEIVAIIFISASVFFGAIGIIYGHSLEQKKKSSRG
jgi:uncharacterized protein YacL